MKVIQISDIHLCQNPKNRLFGLVNTNETFMDVLNKVKDESPDFVIATGDLSQDGSVESYQTLKDGLSTLGCDVYLIDGNHDKPDIMRDVVVGTNIKHKSFYHTDHGTFLFCSSFKKDYDSGLISMQELINLEQYLNTFDSCIIVIHHHFVKLNTFVDEFILENANDLLSLLSKYQSKVKFCITGHVHNSYDVYHNNFLHIHSGLSTCIQFAKTSQVLFDYKKPGYTVYNFNNGSYEIFEKTL